MEKQLLAAPGSCRQLPGGSRQLHGAPVESSKFESNIGSNFETKFPSNCFGLETRLNKIGYNFGHDFGFKFGRMLFFCGSWFGGGSQWGSKRASKKSCSNLFVDHRRNFGYPFGPPLNDPDVLENGSYGVQTGFCSGYQVPLLGIPDYKTQSLGEEG